MKSNYWDNDEMLNDKPVKDDGQSTCNNLWTYTAYYYAQRNHKYGDDEAYPATIPLYAVKCIQHGCDIDHFWMPLRVAGKCDAPLISIEDLLGMIFLTCNDERFLELHIEGFDWYFSIPIRDLYFDFWRQTLPSYWRTLKHYWKHGDRNYYQEAKELPIYKLAFRAPWWARYVILKWKKRYNPFYHAAFIAHTIFTVLDPREEKSTYSAKNRNWFCLRTTGSKLFIKHYGIHNLKFFRKYFKGKTYHPLKMGYV